jgi:type VI protein secretion system component VasF
VIITLSPRRAARRLQQSNVTADAPESKIFNDISTWALSGLWVGLFLLVMLFIGINCLLNLKTNDRFARQNLWVGRES